MKRKTVIILFFLIVLFPTKVLFSQEFNALPKIINYYNANDHLSSEQIFDIKQSETGLLYLASSSYFLEFDGQSFRNVLPQKNATYYSFDIDEKNNRLFIGNKNILSISTMTDSTFYNENIDIPFLINFCWKTCFLNDKAYYFVNKTDAIEYSNHTISVIQRPSNFNIERGFVINKKLYAVSKKGIGEIKDEKLKILSFAHHNVYKRGIMYMTTFDSLRIFIATKDGNLFLMNTKTGKITSFKTTAHTQLSGAHISNGAKFNDTTFILTTLHRGIFIISKTGEIIEYFDKNNGLISNTIYTAFVDKNKNIWLGTGKGLSLILTNSSLKYVDQRMCINSRIVDYCFFQNKLFVSTNDGLLHSVQKSDKWHYSLEQDTSKTIHAAKIISKKAPSNCLIIAGHGHLQLLDTKLTIKSTIPLQDDPKVIINSPTIKNRFFLGTKQGLTSYNIIKKNGKLSIKKEKKIENFIFNIDNLFFDHNNNLWITHSHYLSLIDFDKNENINKHIEYYYHKKNGLPNEPILTIFEINDTLHISTSEGIYYLSNPQAPPANYHFKYKNIGPKINNNSEIINFLQTPNDYFFLHPDFICKTSKKFKNCQFLSISSNFIPYNSKMTYKSNKIWVNSRDEIISIKLSEFKNKNSLSYKPNLRSIKINHDKEHFIYKNDSLIEITKGNYSLRKPIKNRSSLTLRFFVKYFENPNLIQYNYYIKGHSKNWIQLSGQELTIYNLSAGDYEILVKAQNSPEAETITIKFTVKKIIYASIWAIISYVLLLVILMYLSVKIFNKRARKEKKELERIVNKRARLLSEYEEELKMQSKELITQKQALDSEKNKLEVALMEQQQYALVAQMTDNSVLIINKNGKFEWWNRVFSDMFAFKFEKYKNLPLKEAQKKIRPDIFKEIKSYSTDKGTISYTTHETDNNGEKWYQTLINPVIIQGEDFSKFVVIDYNITSEKNTEESFLQQNDIIQKNKNKLNSIVSELETKTEEHKKLLRINENNLEYSKLLKNLITNYNHSFLENIFENYFIINKPKTKLSGDFIWYYPIKTTEKIIFVGDTTGHGIKGMLNTMLTISILKKIITENPNITLNKIFEKLEKQLFNQYLANKKITKNDKLKLTAIKFSANNRTIELVYSGIPLIIAKEKNNYTIEEYKTGKKYLNKNNSAELDTTKIQLTKGDRIYIATNGWCNQLDALKKEKYSTNKINKFLAKIQTSPYSAHQQLITSEIQEWKGEAEQTDDISVFSVQI